MMRAEGASQEAEAKHSPRIAVVVPAFNEEVLIAKTLSGIPRFVHDIIVVDDASQDRTHARASALLDPRVCVLRHTENQGVGAAIVTGYRAAFARGADICAVMAGDAQMHPEDLRSVLEPLLRGEADYAKGNRLGFPHARKHMPLTRWLGNVALGLATRIVTGLNVEDSQCGFTAITASAAAELPLERLWPRYGYPNDLLGMLAERGLRVREVIVRPLYADERSGVGLRHALFIVPFVLLRVLARRIVGRVTPALPASAVLPEADASAE